LSYPAHAVHPTKLVHSVDEAKTTLGSAETANLRDITKVIHLEGARSCQLVMGFTQLASGSVWNTMPAHTHMRRSEVYLYFNIAADQRVVHLMGPGDETRHLVIADKQVVVSPDGPFTRSWNHELFLLLGMGGENQVYSDMDPVAITGMK